MAQKNNFLLSITESLDDIKKNHLGAAKTINKIQRSIGININDENQWETIKKRINGIYQGFFNRLTTKHPDLTKGEIRLAALLKINLTNKEIASILNITTKGLEKSRSRLRKKLHLNSEDKMETYIFTI